LPQAGKVWKSTAPRVSRFGFCTPRPNERSGNPDGPATAAGPCLSLFFDGTEKRQH